MSDGLKLIATCIANGSAGTLTGMSRDLFEEREQEVYDFVRQHLRQYRELPQASTVQTETGQRLPTANESIDYYVDQVYQRAEYNAIRDRFADLREAMSTRNMPQARQTIAAMSTATRSQRRQARDAMQMDEAMGLVLERIENTRGLGGITGVETGWAGFDQETGGYQGSDLISWVGRPSLGKCMHPDTPILLHDGRIRAIKTLKVGDTLMGPDSQPRTVLSTTTGREEMFKVTPSRGESWVCNRSHILVLFCNKNVDTRHAKGTTHLYSVNEFLALSSRVQRALRLVRTGIDFPFTATEVSPYYLGLWLGDGCMANGRISTIDPEVVHAIREEAAGFGYNVYQHETREGFCPQYSIGAGRGKENLVLDYVRGRAVKSGEKRIPGTYLRNDRSTRLSLLAGIVDSDGYLHADGGLYEITTKFPGLRDDILYLARSLGLGAASREKQVNGAVYHRITVTGRIDMVPCRLPRKQAKPNCMRKNALHPGFRLESQGEGDYFGITLDKDHLYLLGDFTVTHNTYLLLKQAEAAHEAGENVLFVTTEMGTEQIARRYASIKTGLNPRLLKSNMISTYMERRLRQLYTSMAGAERFKIFSVGMKSNIGAIEAFMQEFGPSVVFLDGVYLLRPSETSKNQSRTDRITGVYDELKGLNLESETPMIASTQFSRQAGKGGKEGSLENIGYSDAIGTHSSIVVGIKAGPTEKPMDSRWVEFLKGREGEAGKFAINFKFAPLNMQEFTPEEVEQAAESEGADVDWMRG